MKSYLKILSTVLLVAFFGSCQDYDQLVKNPNLPTAVPPSLLLTGVLEHMNDQNAWSGKQGSQSAAQFYLSTYDYYGTNKYDQAPFTKGTNNFEYTTVLNNIAQMEIEAKKGSSTDLNPYSAIAKFLKAYYYNLMSQKLGDLPLSDALQDKENFSPKYDSQKDIYIQILKWLDEANADFASIMATGNLNCVGSYCSKMSGDIYFGNDLAQWQKITNTFTLRVLISLSHKEADADLKIKEKFSAIVGDNVKYPIITGLTDNIQYAFNSSYNPYPKNPTSLGRDGTRENVGSAFLEVTTPLNDPRTYIAATPAPRQLETPIIQILSGGTTTATLMTLQEHLFKAGQTVTISKSNVDGYNKTITIKSVLSDSTFTCDVDAGLTDIVLAKDNDGEYIGVGLVGKDFSDITAYIGAPAGLGMSDLGTNAQGGFYSYVNALRYSFDFGGTRAESAIIIGYPELCFNIAEGFNRGWATGDAESWYKKGITSSMNFLGISEHTSIAIGNLNGTKTYGTVKEISVNNYLSQPSVIYKGGADGLTQILQQKYIAFWQNSNWEAFFNQRRTGVPTFSSGPGTGNNNKIAVRWQYPRSEYDVNSHNYTSSISTQYGGTDDLDGVMWILK